MLLSAVKYQFFELRNLSRNIGVGASYMCPHTARDGLDSRD